MVSIRIYNLFSIGYIYPMYIEPIYDYLGPFGVSRYLIWLDTKSKIIKIEVHEPIYQRLQRHVVYSREQRQKSASL